MGTHLRDSWKAEGMGHTLLLPGFCMSSTGVTFTHHSLKTQAELGALSASHGRAATDTKASISSFSNIKKKNPFAAKAAPVHNPPAESTAASEGRPIPFNKAFANSKSIRWGSWLLPARSKDAELEKIYGFLNLSLESFSAKLHFVRSSLFSG